MADNETTDLTPNDNRDVHKTIDILYLNLSLLEDGILSATKYYAVAKYLWDGQNLHERVGESVTGAATCTLEQMAVDALLICLTRMFEHDKTSDDYTGRKRVNDTTSLHFCIQTLLDDCVFNEIIRPHLELTANLSKSVAEIKASIEKTPTEQGECLSDDELQKIEAEAREEAESRRKSEFEPRRGELRQLWSRLNTGETKDALQRLRKYRNKFGAHSAIDLSPSRREELENYATTKLRGDLSSIYFTAWSIISAMRAIIYTSYEDKRSVRNSYINMFCLFSSVEKESFETLELAKHFGEESLKNHIKKTDEIMERI